MVSASSLTSGIGSGVTPVQILHFKIPPVLDSVSLVKVRTALPRFPLRVKLTDAQAIMEPLV